MDDHIYRVIQIVGSSGKEHRRCRPALAIARASKTLRELRWFEVVETRGHIEKGKIRNFQVTLKRRVHPRRGLRCRKDLTWRCAREVPEADRASLSTIGMRPDHLPWALRVFQAKRRLALLEQERSPPPFWPAMSPFTSSTRSKPPGGASHKIDMAAPLIADFDKTPGRGRVTRGREVLDVVQEIEV